jgi:hypothetical protein
VLAYRDRAILKFFLYSGARIRTIGLHAEVSQAIADYIQKAERTRGPLFRPRLNPRKPEIGQAAVQQVGALCSPLSPEARS